VEEGDAETKKGIEQTAAAVIVNKKTMLNDYFSMNIDEEGNLRSIPCLLGELMPRARILGTVVTLTRFNVNTCIFGRVSDDYIPLPEGLPSYALNLATDVNWENEVECFRTFCKETATFYVYEWMKQSNVAENLDENSVSTSVDSTGLFGSPPMITVHL
jgi:DNA mismatch repair protein MLH1